MIYDLIVYTPVFITFFWAVTLLSTPTVKGSVNHKRRMGFFMLAAFGIYLSHAFFFQGFKNAYWAMDVLYTACSLSVYPLYYCYLRSLTLGKESSKRDLKHFISGIVFTLILLINYLIADAPQRLNYVEVYLYNLPNKISGGWFTAQYTLFKAVRITYGIQVAFYLIAGIQLIRKYESKIVNFYSHIEGKELKWTKLLAWTFFAAAFVSLFFNALGKSYFINQIDLLIIPSFAFSGILFLLGLQANLQIAYVDTMKENETQDDIAFPLTVQRPQDSLKAKLDELFVLNRIHLDPHLKLTDISKILATNRTYISNYINTETGKSFTAFVNKYRVGEAISLLEADLKEELKMEEVAENSGFGSLRSFNRAFLQEVGISPIQFREQIHSGKQPL